MPIQIHIDKSKDLTIFTVRGLLIFDEVMHTARDFYEGSPTKNVLCDLSGTTESLLTLEQVEKLVTFKPRFEGKRAAGKTAIVAQDQFLYGISNVLGTDNNLLGSPHTVMAFSNRDTACDWLDAS